MLTVEFSASTIGRTQVHDENRGENRNVGAWLDEASYCT